MAKVKAEVYELEGAKTRKVVEVTQFDGTAELVLGDYRLTVWPPGRGNLYARLELASTKTQFKHTKKWRWDAMPRVGEDLRDRGIGFSVEISDPGDHFRATDSAKPSSRLFPRAGAELDALVVAEVFAGVPPVASFTPSTDHDHTARVITQVEKLGFEFDNKTPAPTNYKMTIKLRGVGLWHVGVRDWKDYPRAVCEASLLAVRGKSQGRS